MIRHSPTLISLSSRDVREHLEHSFQRMSRGDLDLTSEREPRSYVKNTNLTLLENPEACFDGIKPELTPELLRLTCDEGRNEKMPEENEVFPFSSPSSSVDSEQCLWTFDNHKYSHTTPPDVPRVLPLDDCPHSPIHSTAARLDKPFGYGYNIYPSMSAPDLHDTFSFSPIKHLRLNGVLPRSPLYQAQPLSTSPCRSPTVALTPRLVGYGTPGLLLSQPPRRRKMYRPRSVSYSFEESERSNAMFEDIQTSDNGSNNNQPCSVERRSPSEQSDAGSLHIPFSNSEVGVSIADAWNGSTTRSTMLSIGKLPEMHHSLRTPSRNLVLPPPFATVPRAVSLVASRPIVELFDEQLFSDTYATNSQNTPLESGCSLGDCGADIIEHVPGGARAAGLLALPVRLYSSNGSTTQSTHVEHVSSPAWTDGSQAGSGSMRRNLCPVTVPTPQKALRVFDDRIPGSLQPQTPLHMAESRHQSRYHPSYTAPPAQSTATPRNISGRLVLGRGTRSSSPSGLNTPGYEGLYGGLENTDEEVLFDRASRRLWTSSSSSEIRATRGRDNAEDLAGSLARLYGEQV